MSAGDGGACECCGRDLFDESGQPIRRIDLVWGDIADQHAALVRRILLWGTPAAALACLLSPFIHGPLHFVVSMPLLIVAHAVTLNFAFLRSTTRLLPRGRRFVTRATRRLYFYPLVLLGYGGAAIPIAGAILGGLTFAGLTALVYRHNRWVLDQESRREPLSGAEKAFLAVAAVLAVVVVLVFAILVGLAAWIATKIADGLAP